MSAPSVRSPRVDGTNVWESGGADYGLTPGNGTGGPGAPLSGFAGLVEGTLGSRLGAGAMQSMASPTGYLTIEAQMVTTATPTGTGTVDGVPVTLYQLQIDFTKLTSIPNTTPEEQATIAAASQALRQSGYTQSIVTLAIDASNLVRESKSVATFDDGGTAIADSTFSGFGCSGQVQMPDATGAPTPAPPCTTTPPAQP
jgi:hypothetical protein